MCVDRQIKVLECYWKGRMSNEEIHCTCALFVIIIAKRQVCVYYQPDRPCRINVQKVHHMLPWMVSVIH